MTTKMQEREALEQIKKILETLGADSYVSTALDGCLEIAEENIDNDFGCSMKERAELAEHKIKVLKEEKLHLQAELEEVAAKNECNEELIRQLRSDLQNAKAKQLTPRLHERIWTSAYDKEEDSKKLMLGAADYMAQLSDAPQDIAFQQAVKTYKKAKSDAETAAWIMEQLDKIKPEGC